MQCGVVQGPKLKIKAETISSATITCTCDTQFIDMMKEKLAKINRNALGLTSV